MAQMDSKRPRSVALGLRAERGLKHAAQRSFDFGLKPGQPREIRRCHPFVLDENLKPLAHPFRVD